MGFLTLEIITFNSSYENDVVIGGYHEIHEVKFLQNEYHAIETINSVIKNNLLYGCDHTILENVIVLCNDYNVVNKINNYYQEHPVQINVTAYLEHV